MTTIKREAGDKTKGFTLQKQRALALILDTIKTDPKIHVNVAIEYKGDVYVQNEKSVYIEEEKNYDKDTSFSFNSKQIANTLAYFLDIWLAENKSDLIKFGFYSTNSTTKESNTTSTKATGIKLPKTAILDLLAAKRYAEPHLTDAVFKYLVKEYKDQYNKDISSDLPLPELEKFLNSISWNFNQADEKDYVSEVVQKIKDSEFGPKLTRPYAPDIAYAWLMLSLEEKQDATDPLSKFLSKMAIENIVLKISSGQVVDPDAYKYLNFDYTEMREKTRSYLKTFLEAKYFANIKTRSSPEIIQRKVARHNREVKIETRNLLQTDPEQAKRLEVVIKEIGDFINNEQPTFLFGEIGSGKSTLLAHYFLNDTEALNVFIPAGYIKGKVLTEMQSVKKLINNFVNDELNLVNRFFDLEIVLQTRQELTIVFDGIDELDQKEAANLLRHLLSLANSFLNVRIIGSGRPIELQSLIYFNQWNCLTTLDLTEKEVRQILKNEAVAAGLSGEEIETDAGKRYDILISNQDMSSNATTPLVVCLVRDYLDDTLSSKSLGEILYEVIQKRLTWDRDDQKESFPAFAAVFPVVYQKEPIIAEIAYAIYQKEDGKISEEHLFQIIDSVGHIPKETAQRSKVVNEAINFYKSTFLQKIAEGYTFQSHQLFQVVLGIQLFRLIKTGKTFLFESTLRSEWRVLAFAGAIARKKGDLQAMEPFYTTVMRDLLASRKNTAIVAALLAEVRSKPLSALYIELVKQLDFRPLLLWDPGDSTIPKAYAAIIKDVGAPGFEWFFENYVNPKHPVRDGLEDISNETLRYYISLKGFQLTAHEKELLQPIIPVYIKTVNHSIVYLFPVLVLAMPEEFKIAKRCILLAVAMEKNPDKARAMLMIEWDKGFTGEVTDGLRIACRKKSYNLPALRLLLDLSGDQIPEYLLELGISAAAGGDREIFVHLSTVLGKSNFSSYLRCRVLFQNKMSDSASLLLYKYFDVRDLSLLGEPLVLKTQWFDFKNLERETILNDLVFTAGDKGIKFIIANTPPSESDHGLPEAYTRLFLKCIIASQDLYVNEFLNVVKHLGKFSLSRYPEIRQLFKETLKKAPYHQALTSRLDSLDSGLRYNAACILLVCNPENDQKAMSTVIRTAYRRLNDNQEWLRLCMKLNYGKHMLDFILGLLKELRDMPRLFALTLLYHNGQYGLSNELTEELLVGLSGEGNFLEWSGGLFYDGVEKVAANSKFYKFFLERLYKDDYDTVKSAAGILIAHHVDQLSLKDLAKCWLFYVAYFDLALNEFHQTHRAWLNNPGFTDELKLHARECSHLVPGGHFLLHIYYLILREQGSWITLVNTLQGKNAFMRKDEFQYFYDTINDMGNADPAVGQRLGTDMAELMNYAAYSQQHDNYILPQIAILAHQFNGISANVLLDVIRAYHINMPDVAASILFRLGKIPQEYHADHIYQSIIPFFQSVVGSEPYKFLKEGLEKYLTDGPDIPDNFIAIIEWILLDNVLSQQELHEIADQSRLSAYLALIITYCRNEKVDIAYLPEAEGIIPYPSSRPNGNHLHQQILLKIKGLLLSEHDERMVYAALLIKSIGTDNVYNTVDIIAQLLSLKEEFDAAILIKFFFALLSAPERMNLSMMYQIFEHVSKKMSVLERLTLVAPLRQCLQSQLATKEDRNGSGDLLVWMFSLLLLYIDGQVTAETEQGFLSGLRNVFVQDGQQYQNGNGTLKFKGVDLLAYSGAIFSQIDQKTIRRILEGGLKSDVPEISTLCRLFSAFSSR